ncbi:Diaminopimelate epimerase [Planctomycetes bacterium Pan216]|uniref:Diaminopimelate epimerase n=1 Tax=Kolteria novifilia TaxID=2527975 RepID=A0A518B9E6_9BACT|nr:Diaminopimelate epimerase [Planctomycetes bacterium Pan216]
MRFTKMHGAGNDYVYVNCFDEPVPKDPAAVSRLVADRHFGIGGDGLILICPPTDSGNDARMRMFNADGSESEMCGNGIRCVAKYLYDHAVVPKTDLLIETGRGTLRLELETSGGLTERVRVNMESPVLKAAEIPTTLPGDPPIEVPLEVDGRTFKITAVSMGNPHAITFVDSLEDELVFGFGPKIENHPAFPKRVNVEFVKVLSPTEMRMRVWERGSGETLACGTGACAVAVAGVLTDRTERRALIHLLGGDLELEWSEADDVVTMTGPAAEVFSGEIAIPQ